MSGGLGHNFGQIDWSVDQRINGVRLRLLRF